MDLRFPPSPGWRQPPRQRPTPTPAPTPDQPPPNVEEQQPGIEEQPEDDLPPGPYVYWFVPVFFLFMAMIFLRKRPDSSEARGGE